MNDIAFSGLTCFTVKLSITKSELSNSLDCMVLESNQTTGYYAKHNFPPNKKAKDHHLFLLVKNNVNCFQDIVLRHTTRIEKKSGTKLHISPGQMVFQKKDYQVIRISALHTESLPQIIADFKSIGINFIKTVAKVSPYESVIFFKKFIAFKEIEEGVYQDNSTPNRFFFKINKPLEFDEFDAKIEMIKRNCNFHLFDAFLNHLFIDGTVQDFVGIYSAHCEQERFGELKEHLHKLF